MSRVFALMLRSVAAQALRRVSKHEGAPWVGSGPTSPSRRAHAEACALLVLARIGIVRAFREE